MHLPPELQAALEAEFVSASGKNLTKAAEGLSKRYRDKTSVSKRRLLESPVDIFAYVAFRLPATFGAVGAVFRQLQGVLPNWYPATLTDVGVGPGTVMWAATQVWPGIRDITLLEREDGMIAIGRRFARYSPLDSVKNAEWVKADLSSEWKAAQSDLVTMSYALGELQEAVQRKLVNRLWDMTGEILVIVEPGTPEGFERIRKAREQLIAAGAKIAAPCPHSGQCPMAGDNWCHFSQRISRSQLHRQVKDGELSYEDEKFAFVAAARTDIAAGTMGRVIRHPQVRKGHIRIESCTAEGLASQVVTRAEGELFKRARHLRWGEMWPPAL